MPSLRQADNHQNHDRMKFNEFNWNLYKESPAGKRLIDDFAAAHDGDTFTELAIRLCPDAGINAKAFSNVLEDTYAYKVSEFEDKIDSGESLTAYYVWSELISTGYMAEDEIIIKPGDFRSMIDLVPFLSINLYLSFPDSFVPYLFFSGFAELKSILVFYNIEVPPLPSKTDYEGRCYYYLALNDVLLKFRDEIRLNAAEFCAFLYEFAPSQIETEDIPSTYNHIWISGGMFDHLEKDRTYYWGNNALARKGDWMFLYELSPVSAITSLWRLVSDGSFDPFFKWNAQAAVKHVIDFPSISLSELREDSYFSTHPLVKRKMQGVNGTSITMEDYNNLLRMISDKGQDLSVFPLPVKIDDVLCDSEISVEKDVEEKLLIPLLEKLNLKDRRDYIRQLPIHAGRGHRIFSDFAVYYSDKVNEETAKILIEAKLNIRNDKDLEEAFLQAKSYANLLNSSVIILCDKYHLYVFKKAKSTWDKKKFSQYSWDELKDSQCYFEIAQIFDRKQYH